MTIYGASNAKKTAPFTCISFRFFVYLHYKKGGKNEPLHPK